VWKESPPWVSNPADWPVQRVLEPTPDSKSEAKVIKEIFKAAHTEEDILDQLLDTILYRQCYELERGFNDSF
jgi:phage gp29-like protein